MRYYRPARSDEDEARIHAALMARQLSLVRGAIAVAFVAVLIIVFF